MGRALFSTIYRSSPVVHEEPEPLPTDVPSYATWSQANKFDPDSDEFFMDAEYEAFIPVPSPEQFREQVEAQEPVVIPTNATSPMAMGDDPASYIPRQPVRWSSGSQRFSVADEPEGPWRIVGAMTEADHEPTDEVMQQTTEHTDVVRAFLERADATLADAHRPIEDDASERTLPPLPQLSMPIPIPRSSTPSSGSESPSPLPTTPPTQAYSLPVVSTPPQSISVSMSPPPTVSPRLYTWNRHVGTPGSPSTGRGPLTNPTARTSFSHLASQRIIENVAF